MPGKNPQLMKNLKQAVLERANNPEIALVSAPTKRTSQRIASLTQKVDEPPTEPVNLYRSGHLTNDRLELYEIPDTLASLAPDASARIETPAWRIIGDHEAVYPRPRAGQKYLAEMSEDAYHRYHRKTEQLEKRIRQQERNNVASQRDKIKVKLESLRREQRRGTSERRSEEQETSPAIKELEKLLHRLNTYLNPPDTMTNPFLRFQTLDVPAKRGYTQAREPAPAPVIPHKRKSQTPSELVEPQAKRARVPAASSSRKPIDQTDAAASRAFSVVIPVKQAADDDAASEFEDDGEVEGDIEMERVVAKPAAKRIRLPRGAAPLPPICSQCRGGRHAGCDRKIPCQNCIARNRGHQCRPMAASLRAAAAAAAPPPPPPVLLSGTRSMQRNLAPPALPAPLPPVQPVQPVVQSPVVQSPATPGTPQTAPPYNFKVRCTQCIGRSVAGCDGVVPCGNCQKRGVPGRCVISNKLPPGQSPTARSPVRPLLPPRLQQPTRSPGIIGMRPLRTARLRKTTPSDDENAAAIAPVKPVSGWDHFVQDSNIRSTLENSSSTSSPASRPATARRQSLRSSVAPAASEE